MWLYGILALQYLMYKNYNGIFFLWGTQAIGQCGEAGTVCRLSTSFECLFTCPYICNFRRGDERGQNNCRPYHKVRWKIVEDKKQASHQTLQRFGFRSNAGFDIVERFRVPFGVLSVDLIIENGNELHCESV